MENNKVKLTDIAGYYEEKEEIRKIIDVINNYEEYASKGVYIPRGLILQGPPGTGKTMFTKAIASETKCNFYEFKFQESLNVLDDLRHIFDEAKRNAPSIIYIDEIDRIVSDSRYRASSDLNQSCINLLLTELDGFSCNANLLLVASTNRYESLPESLLRSGRMDKKLIIDYPQKRDIEEILKLYFKDKPLFDNIDVRKLAIRLCGMTGADIKTMVNNTLIEFVGKKEHIILDDFTGVLNAMNFETIGKRFTSTKVKTKVLAHEFGHAINNYVLFGTFGTISAVKYGNIFGFNEIQSPVSFSSGRDLIESIDYEEEFEYAYLDSTRRNKYAESIVALGGLSAEKVFYGEYDSGCSKDVSVVETNFCTMCVLGMLNKKLMYNEAHCEKQEWLKTVSFARFIKKCERKAKKTVYKYRYLGRYMIDTALNNGDSLNDEQTYNCLKYYLEHKKEIDKKYKHYKLI